MALTRITKGVIKPNENYDTHNINSTGIVTAVGANFTGDVNVGGVLTYEDVTSIDSVGIITARNGIDCNGDIDVDGHTNLDNVSIAGVTTSQTINFGTNKRANFANNRFSIHSNGTNSYLDYGGSLNVRGSSGSAAALSFLSDSNVLVSNSLSINDDLDVDGHTNLDNVSVAGVTTFNEDITFKGANYDFLYDRSLNTLKFDQGIAAFGTSGQMTLQNTTITGVANIKANGLYIRNTSNQQMISCYTGGQIELYHNNVKTAFTSLDAWNVYGRTANSGMVEIASNQGANNNDRFRIHKTSAASRLTIQNYASGSWVENIRFTSTGEVRIPSGSNSTSRLTFGGAINIYHDGNMKFENTTGYLKLMSSNNLYIDGAALFFRNAAGTNRWKIDSSGHFLPGAVGSYNIGSTGAEIGDVFLADDKSVQLGNSQDLKIYHDGSHSYIDESGTGNLYIQSTHVNIDSKNGEQFINCIQDGAVELYHDNNKIFNTMNTGVQIYGAATQGAIYLNNRSGTQTGIINANDSGQYFLQHGNSEIILKSTQNSSVELYHNNVKKLETSADGIILTSTDAGSSAGPEITLFRDSSSPADADYLGQIKFQGRDDNGTTEPYAKITGKILDASAGGEDGILEFMLRKNSTNNIAARFRSDSLQLINGTNFTVAGTSEFSDLATFTKSGSALRLNDGSILRLGNADADFFIYHDGSSTDYISAGAGKQLRLTTDDFIIKGANNTETLMSAAKDGGVYLYHNNIVRAETTANGFQITNGTLDLVNNAGSGVSLRNFSAGTFYAGNSAQGDLALYVQDNTNNSIILQANTGEKYIECNMGGSVDLWYHGGLVAKTTQRGLRLTSNLASSGGVSNMLQLDNTGNNTGDGSKITFSRAGTIRSEIEALKNETANNETDIVFRTTNSGSLGEKLRIFGDGSITQNYANPNASAVFRISKSGAGAAELRFDTATVNTSNLYLGTDEQLRIRYGSTEHTRFTSDGFVGINDSVPYTGLTINKHGDYWDTNGNSYIMPEGKILSSWRTPGDNGVDYWVGFVGGYQKTSPTVNIALQPNTSDFNQQSGMYIAGEATSNSTSDFTLGLIRNGNQGGRGTSGAQRAQKEELFRIKNNGNVGINTSTVDTKLHIVHPSANEDVIKIEAKPVTAGTGAKSKIIFQITQSNNQSARLAEIVSHAENGWGGQLSFNVKQTDSTPNNDTEEGLRITSSDSAATNMKMVVDAYLQLGGYNNTNESFVNLATLFSARDMAGSSLVSGQTDTISGYARRRITSDGSGTFFFGPYGAFPAGDYTALFRLKVSDRSGSSTIGYLDIIGNGIGIQGRNTAPRTGTGQSVSMTLQTNDFTASNTYQYFALDFSKSNNAAHIETRFLSYAANTDVYLDHILILPRLNHGVEGVSGMFDY